MMPLMPRRNLLPLSWPVWRRSAIVLQRLGHRAHHTYSVQRILSNHGVRLSVLTGVGVAILVGGLWIALTAATSKTYHLAPLLGAIAPALTVRAVMGTKLGWLSGLALGSIGAAFMFGAWGIILALDIEPATTLTEGIPGDVFGEVVIGSALAVAASMAMHIRTKAPNT